MKFDPTGIPPGKNLPAWVARILTREIETGRIKPGDRLPTEHELASEYGVSRNVVREAIARLRWDGLVDARHGVGAFVIEPARRSTLRIDPDVRNNRELVERLFELRGILEIETAGLAALRRTEADLVAINIAMDRMRGAEKWSEGGVDADLDFHYAVARASGNPYVERFVTFVAEQIKETIIVARARVPIEEIVETTIAEHTAIVNAIAVRDAQMASAAMRIHLHGAANRIGIHL